MARVTDPLRRMGARFDGDADRLPVTIRGGRLADLSYRSPVASAQVKTALLLAGLTAGVRVAVREPWRSRDHTERLLLHLGFDVRRTDGVVDLVAPTLRALRPFTLAIPGDASSAAFFVGLALLADRGELALRDVGVNPTRAGFLRVLERMGAGITSIPAGEAGPEPTADLIVRPAALRGTEVAASEIPTLIDEIPILAVLASRASGPSVFRAVGELRVKESDRLELLARNLRAVGAGAQVEGDDLVVAGNGPVPVGRVDTAGDHRLTMAFAVLGRRSGARVVLSERGSAAVSYPRFFDHLSGVTRRGA